MTAAQGKKRCEVCHEHYEDECGCKEEAIKLLKLKRRSEQFNEVLDMLESNTERLSKFIQIAKKAWKEA